MKKLIIGFAVLAAVTALAAPKGKVMFFYDTEDYVNEAADDTVLFHADLLAKNGFRGNFDVVGFWAQRVHESGREDVFAALRRNCVGSQTYRHSWHPTVCEYTDLEDWEAAYHRCLVEEAQAVGMLKAGVCIDEVKFCCFPGPSISPVAQYVYADLGVKLLCGSTDLIIGKKCDRLVWFCNLLQVPYNTCDSALSNDEMAERGYSVIYTHPCRAATAEFWDAWNLRGTNTAWRGWSMQPMRSAADQEAFRQNWRDMVARVKADSRLEVVAVDDVLDGLKPRTPITPADIPAVLAKFKAGLEPIENPSWCISDVFQAAAKFLRGERSFTPGKAWGFLYAPKGISVRTVLKRSDVVAAAKKLKLDCFVPAEIEVGGTEIGPADMLIAMMEAVVSEREEIVLEPREQLGLLRKHMPLLPEFTFRGQWLYPESFRDEWLSNRLRWQFWTFRYEDSEPAKPRPNVAERKDACRAVMRPDRQSWANYRHNEIIGRLGRQQTNEYDLVLVGDSITHRWENPANGAAVYPKLQKKYRVLNLGCGGDQTQHVLWRLDHGALGQDYHYTAKIFAVMIGVNNGEGDPEGVVKGVKLILEKIKWHHPESKIVLQSILPMGKSPMKSIRQTVINPKLRELCDGEHVIWLDFGGAYLDAEGEIRPGLMMPDNLHPIGPGYELWLDALCPVVDRLLGR